MGRSGREDKTSRGHASCTSHVLAGSYALGPFIGCEGALDYVGMGMSLESKELFARAPSSMHTTWTNLNYNIFVAVELIKLIVPTSSVELLVVRGFRINFI